MKTHKNIFSQVYSFQNLLLAYKKAKKGARQTIETNNWFFNLETNLLELSEQLKNQTYQPAEYRYFKIYEPKEREISVASFTDRIVHHAIVNILEPIYEKIFIFNSYATRKNKGTHKAVYKAQEFLRKNQWFLKTLRWFELAARTTLVYTNFVRWFELAARTPSPSRTSCLF